MSKNKKTTKRPKTKAEKRLRNQRIIAGFLIFCLTLGIIGTGGVLVFANSVNSKAPEMKEDDFFKKESTKLVDSVGNTFYETGQKKIQNIEYDDLPQNLIDALISVEDSRFFEHGGVDVPRFTKAMMTNVGDTIKKRRLMFSQGGSTLTMQLIKNTYFTYENSSTNEVVEAASSGIEGVSRKFQELYLATKLEREQIITKKQTVALYLNSANFGAQDNIIGIQNSAEKFFNKDVKDLSLVESAFLAGVLNAPNSYTPYNSIANAKSRTADVLYYMNYHGYLSDEEYALASEIQLENLLVPISEDNRETLAKQAYVDVVLQEVRSLVKDSDGNGVDASEGGMIVYTAMNPTIQEGIEKVQRREIASMDHGADKAIQFGSTVINNKTGEIVGIGGGYDYKGELVFNNARDNYTQPASVVKPVLDYALAFEYLGWATSHVLVDGPYTYAGTTKPLYNYDNRFMGEITLLDAVAESRNTTAIKTLDEVLSTVGRDTVIKHLQDLGFSRVNEDNFNNQYSIGGSSFETTSMELAGAYGAVMNGGNFIKPHTITRIEFTNGREPIVNAPSAVNVLSDAASYLAAETMRYAVSGPYPGYLRSVNKSYPVYGKTGTNNWGLSEGSAVGAPKNAQRDRLMIASTSEYTTTTWLGFIKHDKEMKPWISGNEASFNFTGKMSSYLLDLVEKEYGRPGALERPGSVANITHITGTFPYQSPLPGMNPDLISTNGLIKKDFLKLVEATPQELSNLASANVSAVENNNKLDISVAITPYPDASKLVVAEKTFDMGGGVMGRRLFDPSWIYGAVRYKTEVKVNGTVVDEKVSEIETLNLRIDYKYTDKIEVCSYYTYDLAPTIKSNAVCSELKLSEPQMSIPRFTNGPVQAFKDFAAQFDLTNVSYSAKETTSEPSRNNYIKSISPQIENTKTTLSSLRNQKIDVSIIEHEYTLSQATKASDFVKSYKDYFSINKFDDSRKNDPIKSISFDGQNGVRTFKLNDVAGKTATLNFD